MVRSRDSVEILSNVFESPIDSEAVLIADVGGTQRSTNWPEEDHEYWKRISYFDGACGHIYITSDTEVSFRPRALHLLEGLSEACSRLYKVVSDRLSDNDDKTLLIPESIGEETTACKFLDSLTVRTTDADIDNACAVPSDVGEQITALRNRLETLNTADPAKEKLRMEGLAGKIEKVHQHIVTVSAALSTESQGTFRQALDTARNLRVVARVASEQAFGSEALPGIGGEVWRELWEAARRYSEEVAYTGSPYPVVNEGSLCVLCEQELSKEASKRLVRFEEFVKDETQRKSDDAEKEVTKAQEAIQSLNIGDSGIGVILTDLTVLDEFKSIAELAESVLQECERRRTRILMSTDPMAPVSEEELQQWELGYDGKALPSVVSGLRDTAAALDSGKYQEEVKAAKSQLAELESRVVLAGMRDAVTREIKRLVERDTLEIAQKACAGKPITDKAKELTRTFVTKAVTDTFATEAEALHLRDVVVKDTGGRAGHLRQKPALAGAIQPARLSDVLSEGEKTALAMAGFLTEVLVDVSQSAVIFDDPVTSLDHVRRPHVAERIVSLAASRQVVVFTHDASFVVDLTKEAGERGVTLHARSVETMAEEVGLWKDYHPWKAKDVGSRLSDLETRLAAIEKGRAAWDEKQYGREVAEWGGDLRETWERIVFNEVIRPVYVQELLEVRPSGFELLVKISDADNKDFQASYHRCSQWLKGHDKNALMNYVAPDVIDLVKEFELVKEWLKRVKKYKS